MSPFHANMYSTILLYISIVKEEMCLHSCGLILDLPETAAFSPFYEAVTKPIYGSKITGNTTECRALRLGQGQERLNAGVLRQL